MSTYPASGGYGGQYPAQQGQYAPAQGQYAPAQRQYPPAQAQYPAQQAQYPAQQAQYPAQQVQYPAQQAQYPAQQAQYPEQQAQYPPAQGQYYPPQGQQPPAGAQNVHPAIVQSAHTVPPPGFKVEGYEHITLDGGFVPPPAQEIPTVAPADQPTFDDAQPALTRDEVKDALSAFVSQHCCYGSGPIKEMQITNVASLAKFKYTLETFAEKRETKWKFEPSRGDNIVTTGIVPPGPWEMPITPKQLFKDETRTVEVPNTQSLRPCHECQANGDIRCRHCNGRGRATCKTCGGSGARLGDQCSSCAGIGTVDCTWCHARGTLKCKVCDGQRNLKYFIELTVTWQVHTDRYVMETPGLPDSEAQKVGGQTVCHDARKFVWAFANFPEQKIAHASRHLVEKHRTGWPMSRILQQRHDVQLISIHKVAYNLSGENSGFFFVCGNEKNVYFPDYPSQCFGCCCALL